jgi:hypothetical protein
MRQTTGMAGCRDGRTPSEAVYSWHESSLQKIRGVVAKIDETRKERKSCFY